MSSSKRARNVLSIETKIQIIGRLEEGETASSLAKIFNVGNATISDIKNKKDQILKFGSKFDGEDGPKKRKTMKKPKDEKLEEAVYLWCVQRRVNGEPISGPLLCEKALELNNEFNGPPDFKASTGWLKNFKSRHGIRKLVFSDNEILSFVKVEQSVTGDENDAENEESVEKQRTPSHEEAFSALETATAWYEQQEERCPTQLLLL